MRSTKMILSLVAALALALGAMACSDDTGNDPDKGTSTKDGGGGGDKGKVTKDSGPPPTALDCKGNKCTEFVLDRILMATTNADAQKYAMEFGGKKYNALGNILSLLASQAPTLGIQDSIDGALCAGKTIVLLKVQAKDMTSDPKAKAQAFTGAEQVCCKEDKTAKDSKKCCAEAKAGCFNGKGKFAVDKASPTDMLFNGKIGAGALSLGPAKMKLKIPLTSAGTLDLTLKAVMIKGKASASGITEGVLSGAIPKSDLDTNVIPQVASMLDKTYQDKDTDKSTKDMIKQLFDIDGDGKITKAEVAGNPLIKTFLAGDVDVDGDGEKELSLGIGFTAVNGVIGTGTTPTPDQGTPTPDKGTPTPDQSTATPDAGL